MNKTSVAQQAKTASFIPPAQGILQRKCACGNQTIASGKCAECKKKKSRLQRKLSIGASNDPLEQEADRVAEQVMAATSTPTVNATPPRIQRFTGQANEGVDTAPASVDRVLSNSGRPLEPALRQDMEQRFSHDFSRVRVHSSGIAEQSARDVNANAYTVGHNVVFGAGRFAPGSHEGRRLIAHELTHVVQQVGRTSPFIQRVCDTAAETIGASGGCTPAPSVFVAGSIFRFNVNCNDFSSGQEPALISHVRAQPATATFKIHGYASTDGAASFNQNLACARILKAHSVLSGAGAAARITGNFNHGPTAGPASDRRSVVIETSTPGPTPAPARTGVITSRTVAEPRNSRTTIEVDEEVDLLYTLGSTTWATTGGTLTFISGNPGPLVRFTAPDTAQFVTITAGASSILLTVITPYFCSKGFKTITVDFVQLHRSTRSPSSDLAVANKVFRPCCVRFVVGQNVSISAATTQSWLGGDTDLNLSGITCASPTTEERDMYNGATAAHNLSSILRVFYPGSASGYRALAFSRPPYCAGGFSHHAVIYPSALSDTLAHEFGHIFLNAKTHSGIDNPADTRNLMFAPGRTASDLDRTQCTTIFNNA